MNEMKEVPQKNKRGLVVLAVLSILNISYELLVQIQALIIGQLSQGKLEEFINSAKKLTESTGVEDVYGIFERMYAVQRIQNDQFYLSHGFALITLILGLAGVILMLQKRSVGFQFYIIYALLSCFGLFLYIPFDIIPIPVVIMNVFVSGIFILLYYLNRSWENREQQPDDREEIL